MSRRPKHSEFSRPGVADPYEEPKRPLHPIIYRLRKRRYEIGVSAPKMAELLGYDEKVVQRWERGLANPSPQALVEWAEFLGARIELIIPEERP